MNGDVGAAGDLEEGAEDARRNVATTADRDHELRVKIAEDARGGFLAEFVNLFSYPSVSKVLRASGLTRQSQPEEGQGRTWL